MLFDTIAGLISERTGCDKDSIKMSSTFRELSIDSLDTVELLLSLEDSVGVQIELSEKIQTVGELVQFVEEKIKESEDGNANL